MTDTPTAERAQSTSSTAVDEGAHVAGVAHEEVKKVAGEAGAQIRSVVGDARTQAADQLGDQTRQQRDNLVSTLGTFGDDLRQMADRADNGGIAADVAREVADRAHGLTSYLDGREPNELLGDVRDFARRRPGLFLLGALGAGVLVGRLARGVKDAEPASGTAAPQASVPTASAYSATTPVPAAAPAFADPTRPSDPGFAPGSVPPSPAYPPNGTGIGTGTGTGIGTDTPGYGRGQDLPGGPA